MLAFLKELFTGGAQRIDVARRRLGSQFATLQERKIIRVLHGLLGPVVSPGQHGLTVIGVPGKPITARTATEQVAFREAIALAVQRGYTVVESSTKNALLRDHSGREHLLYVRVAGGTPSTTTIASLIHTHRPSLQRGRGTLILYTLDPEKYEFQRKLRSDLQVWQAVQ